VEAKSKKTVAPGKADKSYVYAVTTKDGVSRWSFKLSESSLSPDEVRVLKKGHPRAAQALRNLREKVIPKSSELSKQNAELLESETKPNSLKSLETIPDPVEAPAPIFIDLTLPQPLTRTPLVPLPKLVIPEF